MAQKRYIVSFANESISRRSAAGVLSIPSSKFIDGLEMLSTEAEVKEEEVLHFGDLGVMSVALSAADAAALKKSRRVAEVVEDIEVFAHGDCGCGGGAGGASSGQSGPWDPYSAGYQQALQDVHARLARECMEGEPPEAAAESDPGTLAGSRCPPGTRRRCFRILPWFPPICFCVPDGGASERQPIPWNITQIKADQVWSRVTGRGAKVAILDTGIDDDHPDLTVEDGVSFVEGNTSWDDDHSHGTHCAGIVGARNNATGIVGVAPECSLFAVKVMRPVPGGRASGRRSWIIAGMNWAAQKGMDVASMSLGSTADSANESCIIAYQRAAKNLLDNDCLVVSSAGNSGRPTNPRPWVGQPARCSNFMAVAAVDRNRRLADFSSRGPEDLCAECGVEISAPGVSVRSTIPGGGYERQSGTSMACPHVAGAAALLKQLHPTWTPARIRDHLKATASDLGVPGDDVEFGAGLLDCHKAVFG